MHPILKNLVGLTFIVASWAILISPSSRETLFGFTERLRYEFQLLVTSGGDATSEEELASISRVLSSEPCNKQALPLDYSVAAQVLYDRSSACLLSGQDPVWGYLSRGYASYRLGRYRSAQQDFESALDLDRDNLNGHYFLGLSNLYSKRFEESLVSFTRAIELKPELADAYYSRARSLSYLGRKVEAIEDLDRVVQLRPAYFDAHMLKGEIYKELKMFDEALANFDRARALDITNPKPRFRAGETLVEAGDRSGARSAFMASIRLAPDWPEPGIAMATLQIEDEAFEDAVKGLKFADEQGPHQQKALFLRSIAYRNLGRLDEALKDADGAVHLSNELVFYVLERAKVQEARGDAKAAIEDYTKVINHTHSFPEAFEGRIRMYEMINQPEKAEADRKALKSVGLEEANFKIHNAYVAFREGHFREAISMAEAVAHSVPHDKHSQTSLADILSGVGKAEEAYEMHLSAIAIGGRDWIEWYQATLLQKGYDPGDGRGVLTAKTKRALADCIQDQCMLSY